MTDYIYRMALIIQASARGAGNRVGEALGWGPESYTVPLSATGEPPATHYGLSSAATQRFVGMLQSASNGGVIDGVDPSDLTLALSGLAYSIGPATENPVTQFDALCDQAGLLRVGDSLD